MTLSVPIGVYDKCFLPIVFVDCGDPGIANGANAGGTVFGAGAFIICDGGYTGGGLLECQADGTWDSKPACNPKREYKLTDISLIYSMHTRTRVCVCLLNVLPTAKVI